MVSATRFIYGAIVNVILIVGGAKWATVKHHAMRSNTIVLVIDNPNQLALMEDLYRELGVWTIGIGERHTTATLFQGASEQRQADVRRFAPMTTHAGMGANACIAAEASKQYIASPEFDQICRKLTDQVLVSCGGYPPLCRVRELGSEAGGVGSGAGPEFGPAIALTLASLGVPVQLEFDLLGPMFVTGLSENCRLNAGAVLPSLVEKVTNNAEPTMKLVTMLLEVSELPPLGEQLATRDQLIVVEEQAITSPELRQHRDVVLPNDAMQGRLGNVHKRRTDFVASLDPVLQVRPAVAAAFHPLTTAVLNNESVNEALLDKEVWSAQMSPLTRSELTMLVADIEQVDIERFVAGVEQAGGVLRYELSFDLPGGARFEAREVEHLMGAPPNSFEQAASRLMLLATTAAVVTSIQSDRESDRGQVRAEITAVKKKVRQAFKLARQRGRWFDNSQARRVALLRLSELLRALADEERELLAQSNECSMVIQVVSAELIKLRDQLRDLQGMLARYLPRADQSRCSSYVEMCDSALAFQQLFDLPQRSEERQHDVLCSLAYRVTRAGLAAMLGTKHADIGEIARAIVFKAPAYRSPPFGGAGQNSEPKTFYSLPPAEPRLATQIAQAVSALAPRAVVVFNDSMACGCAILRLNYHTVHHLEDVFCGLIRHNTLLAHTRPDRDMLCPGGMEALSRLGIEINGDLTFPKELPDSTPR